MFNYSDYTLKTFCCGIDLKTATYVIAVAHFIFLNSILYSWEYYTGEKIFWTIIQAIATISLFVGVYKVKMRRSFVLEHETIKNKIKFKFQETYVLYLPWIVVVFPSVAAIIVGIAFIALVLIVFVGPMGKCLSPI